MKKLIYFLDNDSSSTKTPKIPSNSVSDFHRNFFNESEMCNQTQKFASIQNLADFTLFSCSFFAALMNLVIIFCAFRIFLRRNHDTIHVYIISMTLGDLVLVLCNFLESLDRVVPGRSAVFSSSFALSLVVNFLNWLGWTASGLSLVLLNSDKLLFFCFPLYYRLIKSVRRAVAVCASIWLISFCFVMYAWSFGIIGLIEQKTSEHSSKYIFYIYKPKYYSVYVLVSCVVPISSSLMVSCYLLRLMHRKRCQRIAANGAAMVARQRPNADFVPLAPAFSHKLRSLVFIFTTTVWSAISLLPYRIFVIVRLNFFNAEFLLANCDLFTFLLQLGWILHYMLVLYPVVNPFITAIIYHPYRVTLAKQLSASSSTRSTQL